MSNKYDPTKKIIKQSKSLQSHFVPNKCTNIILKKETPATVESSAHPAHRTTHSRSTATEKTCSASKRPSTPSALYGKLSAMLVAETQTEHPNTTNTLRTTDESAVWFICSGWRLKKGHTRLMEWLPFTAAMYAYVVHCVGSSESARLERGLNEGRMCVCLCVWRERERESTDKSKQ